MKASLQMVQPPTGKDNYSEALRRLRICGDYFFCAGGLAGAGGGAGCVLTGCDLTPCKTEPDAAVCLLAYTARVMEVTMNATADQVVARERALAAPRGPNAVWLPCPPKAAEMSPLLPLCSSTTTMMNKHTKM